MTIQEVCDNDGLDDYIATGLANNDCTSLAEWLHHLSDFYNVDYITVEEIALALGPDELFDGLVSTIRD